MPLHLKAGDGDLRLITEASLLMRCAWLEGRSQRVITERGCCSRSAVSKHIKYKVDWKEEIGYENVHKQQGWPQAWEYCQAKPIQTLGRASQGVDWSWSQCIKSHHAQTSSGKALPSHFWNTNIVRSILPGLRRKMNLTWTPHRESMGYCQEEDERHQT